MTKKQCYSFYHRFSFWEHLTEREKELLAENTHCLSYRANEAIQSEKSSCLGTIFIRKGILRVYLLSEDGREATLYRLRDNDVCTLSASCMLSSITFDVQIDAETDCDLFLLPAPFFSSFMKQNIYVENFIYKLTTEHFSDVIHALERTFFLTLRQRIIAFLLDESAQENTSVLTITLEHLAKDIGSARESVSRILKQLSSEGSLKVSRKGIELLDKKRLYREL